MGMAVESIEKKHIDTILKNANLNEENNNLVKEESIFFSDKNKSYLNATTLSIAGTVLLGLAGICLAPKLLKFIKNCKMNTNMKNGLKSTKTASSAANAPKVAETPKFKPARALSDAEKKAEIERLEKLIKEEKDKFFAQNESKFIPVDENNPLSVKAYEERVKEIFPNMRGAYGMSSVHLDRSAEGTAGFKDFYLNHLWNQSQKAKELYLQLELAKMSPEEIALFNNAVRVLKSKNIPFHPYELVKNDIGKSLMSSIGRYERFAGGTHVIGSDYAFRVNGLLRRGIEPDDLVMRVLDQGFKDVEPFYGGTVYRSVMGGSEDKSIDFINALVRAKRGTVFVDKGYSFSTFRREAACPCNAIQDVGSPEVILKITIPKGAKISDNSFTQQREVLFPRNARFKALGKARVIEPGIEFTDGYGIRRKTGGTLEIPVKYVGNSITDGASESFLNKIKSFFSR